MSPIPKIRVFISSPGDVGREREATRRVIDRLQSEFAEHVTLDPYFWEWEPVDFSHDYQSQIPSTADFEIVICLLWSKLGSRLGDQYKLPPNGEETASSGTQYELMQALHGKQQHPQGLPDLLVWVNKAPPPPVSAPPLSRKDEDELIRQRRALQDFLASITRDSGTGIFTAAVNRYQVPGDDFGSYQYLDEFEDMMDRKLRKLIQKHIGERTVKPKPQWQGSPFRDLDVFDFEHERIFFGRSRAIGEVVRLLQNTLNKPEPCHFALVLGASGSGKSSIARAGVLPLLTRPGVIEGIGLWRCAIVRPSDDSNDLFLALASALLRIQSDKPGGCPAALPELADTEADVPQQALGAELRAHPQSVAIRVKDQLNSIAKAHRTEQSHTLEAQIASLTKEGRQADATQKREALQQLQDPKARLVLLLDQMEELFTLNYAPEQLRAFLETIDVLARSGRVFVIATLRSDFYHRFQNPIPSDQKTLTTLVDLARDGARFDLLPPTPDEISQIIRSPARLAGLEFEPHPTIAEHTLADTLRDEALADPESLPLLEHVLNRLFEAQLSRADGRLTFADHIALGGVGGALGRHAEDIFTGQNLKPEEPPPPWTEDTFRAVFGCLVTFGKGDGDADVPNRRAFAYDDLIKSEPAAQVLVDTFIHERLFTADKDTQSRAIVRLSHEALLTRWHRLSQWLQTAPVRDLMSQRRRLESSLRQWQEQNRTPDCYLQPGFELEEGKQLLENHVAALRPEEREFILCSITVASLKSRRTSNIRRAAFTALSVSAILAVAGATFGWHQAHVAGHAAQEAYESANSARLEAARAESSLQQARSQIDQSTLEEGKAWLERARAAKAEGDNFTAIMLAGRSLGFVGCGLELSKERERGSFPPLLGLPFSYNLHAESQRRSEELAAHDLVCSLNPSFLPCWLRGISTTDPRLAFSPDGLHIAISSDEGSIEIRDARDGNKIAEIKSQRGSVTAFSFSHDGRLLAISYGNNTITLWEVETGVELIPLKGPIESVDSLMFSPDDSQLVSNSWDLNNFENENAKLWDVKSGSLIASHKGRAAFASDGNLLLLALNYTNIKILDAASGNELVNIPTGRRWNLDPIFSPQSELLAIIRNTTVFLWHTRTRELVHSLVGHESSVSSIVFNPDGTCLASGCSDGEIKIWDTSSGKELGSAKLWNGGVYSLVYSPDGTRLVACGNSDRVAMLDVASTREISKLSGHADRVNNVDLSKDGTLIASASDDKTVKIWDAYTGKLLASLEGHKKRVLSVSISPDGKLLASGSDDNTVKLWDVATGRQLATLNPGNGAFSEVAFRFDGRRLVSRNPNDNVKVWDVATGKNIETKLFFNFGHYPSAKSENSRISLKIDGMSIRVNSKSCPLPDLLHYVKNGLLKIRGTEVVWDDFSVTDYNWEDEKGKIIKKFNATSAINYRDDPLANLASKSLNPLQVASMRLALMGRASQWRSALAYWDVLQKDSPTLCENLDLRREYLFMLLTSTANPHATQAPDTFGKLIPQITTVLDKQSVTTPGISLPLAQLIVFLASSDTSIVEYTDFESLLEKAAIVTDQGWKLAVREMIQERVNESEALPSVQLRIRAVIRILVPGISR